MSDAKPDEPNTFQFETALQELEQLVEGMERGDLSLEDSLRQFERGVQLTRACQQALQAAEHKVEILQREGENPEIQDFADGE